MTFNQTQEWTTEEQEALAPLLRLAVLEDVGPGDLTTNSLVPEEAQGRAKVVARTDGVIAGLPAALQAYAHLDSRVRFEQRVDDGSSLVPGKVVAMVEGPARSLLTGERLALNLIGRLSGIATLTRRYVDAVAGTKAEILDTRKTTPGWRLLEKYAVRAGGGRNHRRGLYDGVLIKDNHLACGEEQFTLPAAIERTRADVPVGTLIEIEVDTLAQLEEVLPAAPDIVLLDNMSVEQLREAVELRDRQAPDVQLEASGGITLDSIRPIAQTGVERISIGALTHSATSLDVGLDWELG